jgi:hypothetical protein
VHGQNYWPIWREPSLDDLLSDPIAVALMRSDGLTRRDPEAVLARAKAALRSAALAPPHRRAPPLMLRREPDPYRNPILAGVEG